MTDSQLTFEDLGLNEALLKALKNVGYELPSPIQREAIPLLLTDRDIIGQAQTGTGKTAAFALPLLQKINLRSKAPQVLVLAPTRELAIQVAEAFQQYAHYMTGFNVLPIYGGQGYDSQIRSLKRGVHVVVGTPGRVMDHIRKGTFKLDDIKHLVLDEADEMLRMGFIDDVEWVLGQLPTKRQIALFSATMPREIAKVANTYLIDPATIKIKVSTANAAKITQQYWPVSGLHKLDALTRILEMETFDAMIVFVRTKTATVELAEKLQARGYASSALNGDISQAVREKTVERLKNGKIDVLVATDVAARGLDVDRISHVLNYDIPYDTEAYVHRIGRTGRAGREGKAILFVAKRELRMLKAIETATGKQISPMSLPTAADINKKRVESFKQKVLDTIASPGNIFYKELIEQMHQEFDHDYPIIAAALAELCQGEQSILLRENAFKEMESSSSRDYSDSPKRRSERSERPDRPDRDKKKPARARSDVEMETFRIEVGHNDQVSPKNIVGAIANEADISSSHIGHIKIHDEYSTVDLPAGLSKEKIKALKNIWVCQKQLNLSPMKGVSPSGDGERAPSRSKAEKPRSDKPKTDKPKKVAKKFAKE